MRIIAKNPFIFMIIGTMILGSNSVILKLGTENFPPLAFGGLRYLLSGLLFMIIAYKQPIKHIEKFIKEILISTGILILFAVCWILGVHYSAAINMAIFGLISPLLVYIGSIVFLGEPKSNRGLIGSLIALIGGIILIAAPLMENNGKIDQNLFGNILLFLSVLGMAAFILHTKRLYKYASVEQINGFRLTLGGLVLFFISMLNGDVVYVDSTNYSALIYLLLSGVFTGFVGIYIFYTALKNMRAEDAAPIFYIDNLTGVLLGSIILGETLGKVAILASGIIISGVIIAHPIHLHRAHYYLDPTRHTFEEFFHWLKIKYLTVEKTIKKLI